MTLQMETTGEHSEVDSCSAQRRLAEQRAHDTPTRAFMFERGSRDVDGKDGMGRSGWIRHIDDDGRDSRDGRDGRA